MKSIIEISTYGSGCIVYNVIKETEKAIQLKIAKNVNTNPKTWGRKSWVPKSGLIEDHAENGGEHMMGAAFKLAPWFSKKMDFQTKKNLGYIL